jgi:hypothetical protein
MELSRRKFTQALLAGATGAIAGCGGKNGGSTPTEERSVSDRSFQYFFEEAPGFNQVGGDVSDDAEEWQVVNSALERREDMDSWREMQLNDHHMARLDIEEGVEPHIQGHDGSVEEIVEQTRANYQKRTSDIQGEDAVEYTLSLRNAVKEVTNQSDSLAADVLNTNLAEWVLDQLEFDIPEYKLTTLYTTKHATEGSCESLGCAGAPREKNGQTYLNSGFVHPIGFLQYREEGNLETKYFELESQQYTDVADPENSIFRSSLEKEEIQDNGTFFPEHHVSAFDYGKARQLESQGVIDSGQVDLLLTSGILAMVDDVSTPYDYSGTDYETGADWSGTNLSSVVSDTFGESVVDYVTHPTEDKHEYLEGTSRAVFSALTKHGSSEPIALDGTIQNPEILHPTQETRDSIIEDAAYDEVRERILN